MSRAVSGRPCREWVLSPPPPRPALRPPLSHTLLGSRRSCACSPRRRSSRSGPDNCSLPPPCRNRPSFRRRDPLPVPYQPPRNTLTPRHAVKQTVRKPYVNYTEGETLGALPCRPIHESVASVERTQQVYGLLGGR